METRGFQKPRRRESRGSREEGEEAAQSRLEGGRKQAVLGRQRALLRCAGPLAWSEFFFVLVNFFLLHVATICKLTGRPKCQGGGRRS